MDREGLSKILKEKKHKYGAKRTTCLYKHEHDSRKEAMWCVKLHGYQAEGCIKDLRVQPWYSLNVNGIVVCQHLPDFYFRAVEDNIVLDIKKDQHCVFDVKGDWEGALLPVWKLKHKLFCALYPEINYQVV